jgi:putative membrane protein
MQAKGGTMKPIMPIVVPLLLCAGGVSLLAQDQPRGDLGAVSTNDSQQDAARNDQRFIDAALSGGRLEVRIAQLALRQTPLPEDVREASKMMLDDHANADNRLEHIANAQGFRIRDDLSGIDQWRLDRLKDASGTGREFLEAYDSLQVRLHGQAIALFKDEARDAGNAELKAFVESTLPVLEHHAQMVGDLPYANDHTDWWKRWQNDESASSKPLTNPPGNSGD